MKKLNILFLAIVSCSLIGCASSKQFKPMPDQSVHVEDETKARVYVIRPAAYFGSAVSMSVFDQDEIVGKTMGNTFLSWEREPGTVKITGKAENESWVEFQAEANTRYYILQSVKMGVMIARNKLEIVDEVRGKNYLLDAKPPKKIVGQ